MPIIVRPTVTKGVAANLTLDKDALAALGLVVTDPFFSDQTNWKSVTLLYTSTDGSQNTTVQFDCTQPGQFAEGRFKVSFKAKGTKFEIAIIRIVDFDGGNLYIKRSDVTGAEWDVNLIGIAAPSSLEASYHQNPDSTWYVVLTFTSVAGAQGYRVFRGYESGVYSLINDETSDYDGDYVIVSGNKVYFDEFIDDVGDISDGETLFYMVRSVLETEVSSDSPEATLTIPGTLSPPEPVSWSTHESYAAEQDGGLTTTPTRANTGVYDNIGSISEYEGNFELVYVVNPLQQDGSLGVTDIVNDKFFGFIINGSQMMWHIFDDSQGQSVNQPNTQYTYRVKRVGSQLQFYVNDVLSYTTIVAIPTGAMRARANLISGDAIISAEG